MYITFTCKIISLGKRLQACFYLRTSFLYYLLYHLPKWYTNFFFQICTTLDVINTFIVKLDDPSQLKSLSFAKIILADGTEGESFKLTPVQNNTTSGIYYGSFKPIHPRFHLQVSDIFEKCIPKWWKIIINQKFIQPIFVLFEFFFLIST